ncbi:MAG: PLP-dependent lyase/thiolase [Candidatus Delongbacteria bacterium]|nr:PLP-dependent lyase/thiolase [Candidatus Delongbacteria bacterium]
MDKSYQAVLNRKNEIMKQAMGIDYSRFEQSPVRFDYEGLMASPGYSLEDIRTIQHDFKVGNTPMYELRNLTERIRQDAGSGLGARIFLKDEAANASGSFKARRASLSVYEARKKGYQGVIAATSGNYGAAVASQAAQQNLKCIIIQEVFDSAHVGQPEIIEKSRKCEAFGAEVQMCTVGPELFYRLLMSLEETGFFNASLYTPYSIAGIETLGVEVVNDIRRLTGTDPDAVIITHAGGGNVTGTARGIRRTGADRCRIIGASVDLKGLHMASDRDFNMKSFTTGHTGFGIPFATWPDRADVPRNAARSLRYLDELHLISQGEVFYATEILARLEGIERGPAGNTSLAVAISVARTMPRDSILVIQETEYTGAGKHPLAQLKLARERGITVQWGNPAHNTPGQSIIIPKTMAEIHSQPVDMDELRRSYLKNIRKSCPDYQLTDPDYRFVAEDCHGSEPEIRAWLT